MVLAYTSSGRARVTVAAVAMSIFAAASATAAPTISILGALPGVNNAYAYSYALSGDGSTVGGFGYTDETFNSIRALRWSNAAPANPQSLGTPTGGTQSSAAAMNSDGSVITGYSDGSFGRQAIRWTSGGGMQTIGTLTPSGYSLGTGISGDGSAITGISGAGEADPRRAFLWTQGGGMQDLGTLAGGVSSEGYAISADASVVVGGSQSSNGPRSFRWTAGGGMQNLGTLPGGGSSDAFAVNANGSVVVGAAIAASGLYHAYRWTEGGGMQDLGTLATGYIASARGVSADGSSVVGFGSSPIGDRAFLWTASLGMVDLNTYLPTLGLDLSGWQLLGVGGISADGSALTGSGLFNGQPRSWVITGIPAPGAAAILPLIGLIVARRRR